MLTSNASTGICDPGDGCDVVNSSVYGSTLGIKNSVYGIFIFSFTILLTLLHINKPNKYAKRIIHSALILGSLVSLYFLYLQLFVIKAFCGFCLLVDLSLLTGLGFMMYKWNH
jgi:uncharacterized membrane protein